MPQTKPRKPSAPRRPSTTAMIKLAQDIATLASTSIYINETQSEPLFTQAERERLKFYILAIVDRSLN